ncbi:MAG: ABC transporter substrate-binding protein [Candidatus Altiarchaeota archaeon]
MNTSKNKVLFGIGIFAIAFFLFGAFFLPSTETPTGHSIAYEQTYHMRVGYLPVLVNLPLFVALDQGFFEDRGLVVEAIEAQSPNHIVEAIIAGNLDGAGILADPILFAAEEKFPGEIKIFATTDETKENYVSAIIVGKDSGIEKPEDLIGKKVGVYTGLVQVLFLKGIIAGMGFDPETDIEIVEIAPRLQLQGLEAGQYDALSTVEPFVTTAESMGIGRVLIRNPRVKYIQNPFPSVATPLSADFIKENPKAARAYLLAIHDAIDFIRANPEKAKSILSKYAPIPEDVAQKVTLPRFNKFGEEDRANMQKNADWMVEKGLLKKGVIVESMFGERELLAQG